MRDSDWLAWPRSPGPHVARGNHSLQIALNSSDGPFLSSGEIIEQTEDTVIYSWESPGQFLVAAGAYRRNSSIEGDTWVGKLSTEQTTATARKLLRRRALGEWLEDSPRGAYQALPYIQNIALGGLILGFPNDIESRISLFATAVSSFDSSSEASPVAPEVKTYTPAAAIELNLAIEVSRAWLSNQIRWPRHELSVAGTLGTYQVTCEPPDDTGNQECIRESLGGVNPQAPDGRWREEAESQSEVTPLLQAFAVVIAHELVLSLAEDQAFIGGEHPKWERAAGFHLEGQADNGSSSSPFIMPGNQPVGAFEARQLPACPFRRGSHKVYVPIRERRAGGLDRRLHASTSIGRRPSC